MVSIQGDSSGKRSTFVFATLGDPLADESIITPLGIGAASGSFGGIPMPRAGRIIAFSGRVRVTGNTENDTSMHFMVQKNYTTLSNGTTILDYELPIDDGDTVYGGYAAGYSIPFAAGDTLVGAAYSDIVDVAFSQMFLMIEVEWRT